MFAKRKTEEQLKADRLFEEALDLIIRFQEDPRNPVANELISRWRARGPDHEAAWAEVAEIHGMTGRIIDDRRRAERDGKGISRRNVIMGSAAGLVAAGTGTLFGPDLLLHARADHATTTAELRRIELSDGSFVTLGPDSAVSKRFTSGARAVELLSGMAFFDVSPDAARPFHVSAHELTITVLGTAFDISQDAGAMSVSVEHGTVEVAFAAATMRREVLSAGEWMTLDTRSLLIERGNRDSGLIASWRDGMIVAERETVASVAARIARWHRGRVIVADPRFGNRRISGVFDVRNPVSALEAVVHLHGGTVRQLSPWLTIISPI